MVADPGPSQPANSKLPAELPEPHKAARQRPFPLSKKFSTNTSKPPPAPAPEPPGITEDFFAQYLAENSPYEAMAFWERCREEKED